MKKVIIMLLTLCLLAACAFAGAESPALAGKPWVDSNVYGNWPSERPGPEESFDLYVNFDTYQKAPTEIAKGIIAPSENTVKLINEYLESICTEPDKAGTEGECLRILYRLYKDAKQDVFSTLKAHVERLRAAKTPEELTELIREEGCLYGNALYQPGITMLDGIYEVPTDVYYVNFGISPAIDYLPPDEETYEVTGLDYDTPREMLQRMGWSEEETAQLLDKIAATVETSQSYEPQTELEEELIRRNGTVSLNEIREIGLPVYELIKAQGMAREDEEAEPLYVYEASELRKSADLFREENLETAKAILALGMYRQAESLLPKETEDVEADTFNTFRRFIAPQVVQEQAFVHTYIPQERIDIYRQLVDEYKAAMRVRIGQNSQLSEESKKEALNKIDHMIGSEIMYPYGEIDCSSLLEALRSAENLLEANGACLQLKGKERVHYAGKKIDRGNRYMTSEGAMNEEGKYYPMNNAFFIGGGALIGEMADFTSRETILATLGFHLGHELSHGFDTQGSRFDAVGKQYDEGTSGYLFTEEDRDAFSARAKVIAGHISQVDIWDGNHLNGDMMIGEVMADLTSVQLAMDIAKQTEGFDYDAYFRAFAKAYYFIDYSSDHMIMRMGGEVHPPHYFRVNFTLAHFDEFYQTYPSVTEGTPMYIAPEDRTLPW